MQQKRTAVDAPDQHESWTIEAAYYNQEQYDSNDGEYRYSPDWEPASRGCEESDAYGAYDDYGS